MGEAINLVENFRVEKAIFNCGEFNDLVTKNFNNYLKKYFYSINYTDKNGDFINYYNFINDLDSFSDTL